MTPFFSVIIPTYNRADLIPNAIQSVLEQTFKNFELIIVDDGSTDQTKDLVLQIEDSRIKYLYQENAERSAARNNGISHATGDYICFLDSDDIYLPIHLEVLYDYISKSDQKKAFFYTGRIEENENGKMIKRKLWTKNEGHPVRFFLQELMQLNSACIHKDLLVDIKFDVRFNIWEDNHFALRLLSQFPFLQIEEYTTVLNHHEGRGVAQSFSTVKMETVNTYVECINDLFTKYDDAIAQFISQAARKNYIDQKLNMFLYQARINKEYKTAYRIGFKIIANKQSMYNLIQLIKVPVWQILKSTA